MKNIFRFTNKIQSTLPGWRDRLVQVASVFSRFDGDLYAYEVLRDEFTELSDRLPSARDSSDFRDEFGAYGRFLGLYYEKVVNGSLHLMLTETAKRLLLSETPDVAAFLRLQLVLFQYPCGLGLKWNEARSSLNLEWQAQDLRAQQLRQGTRVAPFRLILQVLALLQKDAPNGDAYLSNEEVYYVLFQGSHLTEPLANQARIAFENVIEQRQAKRVYPAIPQGAFRNYHIVFHTELVLRRPGGFGLPVMASNDPRRQMLDCILDFGAEFQGFNHLRGFQGSDEMLKQACLDVLVTGAWGEYFDALSNSPVPSMSPLIALHLQTPISSMDVSLGTELQPYDLNRPEAEAHPTSRILADADVTQARLERANLDHRIAERILYERLVVLGSDPYRSVLIDMYAVLDRPFLFEIKSIGQDNFLSQVRKAIAQLYEYQYRESLPSSTTKVLFLASVPPMEPNWIVPYLVHDREIAVAWTDASERIFCVEDSRTAMDGIPTA